METASATITWLWRSMRIVRSHLREGQKQEPVMALHHGTLSPFLLSKGMRFVKYGKQRIIPGNIEHDFRNLKGKFKLHKSTTCPKVIYFRPSAGRCDSESFLYSSGYVVSFRWTPAMRLPFFTLTFSRIALGPTSLPSSM